jgi:Cd2+/Zn2+-exporting ATPase
MDCAKGLEASIAALPNVEEAQIKFFDGTLSVRGKVDEKVLSKLIGKLGYSINNGDTKNLTPADEPNALLGFWRFLLQRIETQLALIASGIVLLSLATAWLGFPDWVTISMQIGGLLIAGWPIARSGLTNLWYSRTLNINFLMTVAGIGAVVIGEYFEAVTLILLFDIAEALESFTNERARGAIANLTELAPTHAIKLEGHVEEFVPVEKLKIGDVVLIRPGDRIPIDGIILEGQSDNNQAPITGESIPVWKEPGDSVYSGAVNGNGRLILEVTHLVGDSTLHRIIKMVTKAQSRQSESQKTIDKFAQVYTPIMVLLAILLATVPPLIFGEPFLNLADGTRGWLHRSLVLLVISCPCALVISTPVTMIASLTKAAKEGVLFKGGIYIETLSRIKAIAFDKTGTLTPGKPKVVEIRDLACDSTARCNACDDLLALAYALERHSTHPLAHAVVEAAQLRGVTEYYPAAQDLQVRGGLGIEGRINGRLMTLGNYQLFQEEHVIPPIVDRWVKAAESEGYSTILLCDGDQVRGFIAVSDTPRTNAKQVIKALNSQQIHTVMLTGDNRIVARAVGERIGLDDIRSNLLPGEKSSTIAALQEQYGVVGMIGDGINDAPALARADVGIAVGGGQNAQAMETADVVLMANDIEKLPFAIKLSAFANRLIQQNIIFSLGSKLLVALIALLGVAPLWLAVLADMGVSLIVTLNGLRAMRFQP